MNAEPSMPDSPDHEVTSLLQAWSAGDERALDKLAPLVYQELHRTAHRYMARENSGHTLQTTALVNEVYLRSVNVQKVDWQGRAHFYAICARMMRRVLTDFARSRRYLKEEVTPSTYHLRKRCFPAAKIIRTLSTSTTP